jgi:hypothetical protein
LSSIEIDVGRDLLRVAFGRGQPPEVIENVAVLRDNHVIVAFGTSKVNSIASANATYRAQRPFSVEAFNPDLADAVTRHLVMLGDERSGARLRAIFGRGEVRLRWTDWPRLSPEQRRSYLRSVAIKADIEINGRMAVRGSHLRSVLGIDPSIESWAVE